MACAWHRNVKAMGNLQPVPRYPKPQLKITHDFKSFEVVYPTVQTLYLFWDDEKSFISWKSNGMDWSHISTAWAACILSIFGELLFFQIIFLLSIFSMNEFQTQPLASQWEVELQISGWNSA